jgi:hypothetical protein
MRTELCKIRDGRYIKSSDGSVSWIWYKSPCGFAATSGVPQVSYDRSRLTELVPACDYHTNLYLEEYFDVSPNDV